MAYEFHYTPTGTGVISGKEVLEQTEDAINDLSGQISGDVQTAIDTANNALNTANTASADAQNAVNTASTAYTAATNAQNTASNALTAAQNAQNDVNALGNRVTTAEGNITQNTNAITGLTTRMGTAEGNIGNLQTAVSTAQATANSAQQTATTARQQSYVVRYASVAVSDNSTVPYTDLNNTDNVKANDLLLDTNGKFYQITSVDTSNETVSVTTPLTQLLVDSDVVHKSGDETVDGIKTFNNVVPIDGAYLGNELSNDWRTNICLRSNRDTAGKSGAYITRFRQNKSQGAIDYLDQQQIGIDFLENSVRTTNIFNIVATNWTNGIPRRILINSAVANNSFGSSTRKCYINELNPGALSLPDLDNGIDISGYINVGQTSQYTAPADGYISISCHANTNHVVCIKDASYDYGTVVRAYQPLTPWELYAVIPVIKNHTYTIIFSSQSSITLDYARFFPCQGNV